MDGKIEVGSQEWTAKRFQERLAFYREMAASPVLSYADRLLYQARADRLAAALGPNPQASPGRYTRSGLGLIPAR